MTLPALLWLACSLPARAEDPARAAERAGDFAAEQRTCQDLQVQAPASAAGVRCARRLAWLARRQDPDGSFRSLSALEDLRRQARALPPEQARQRAAAIAAAPPATAAEQVRHEAALWLARQALSAAPPDPGAALAWTEPLWQGGGGGGGGVEDSTRRELADLHARALLLSGQPEAAQAIEAASAPHRSARPREGMPLLLLEQRRAQRARLALGILGVYGLLALPALAAALRARGGGARPRPMGAAILAVICGAAAGLAAAREGTLDSLPAFGGLLGGMVLIHLLAATSLAQIRRPLLRGMARLAAAVASGSVGYLALHAAEQLDVFGM